MQLISITIATGVGEDATPAEIAEQVRSVMETAANEWEACESLRDIYDKRLIRSDHWSATVEPRMLVSP